MIYVPVTPPPPPSPEAQELGGHLVDVIKAYQADHPDMSRTEVRQAVSLAQAAIPGGHKLARLRVVAMVVVLLTAIALVLARLSKQ